MFVEHANPVYVTRDYEVGCFMCHRWIKKGREVIELFREKFMYQDKNHWHARYTCKQCKI